MKYLIVVFFLFASSLIRAQDMPVPAHMDNDVTKKMGYVNPETGKWVVPPTYDFCRPFGPDGTAVVILNGRAGFIDTKGKLVIPMVFDDAQNFNEDGVAIVRKIGDNSRLDAHQASPDRYGAIDRSGKLIIPYVFRELNDKSLPGTLVGKQKYHWGLISSRGKVILPFEYDMINVHKSREVAILRRDSLLSVINKDLVMVVPEGDNMARFAGNNLISLWKNGKYGYCNFNGEMVIDYQFDQFAIFREGLCVIKRNGFYGYIDTLGKTVIPFVYDGGEPFVNDTAIVLKQGKMGMINPKNEVLVEFIYDKISRFYFPKPPGGIVLIRDEQWFFIDPQTHEIRPWDEIDMSDPNLNKPQE